MGMTIDDTINSFQYMRNHPTTDEEEVIKAGQELFDTAIDTMRKYQQIKQIIKDWEDGRFSDVVGCLRVKVVLDGKIDESRWE